MLRSVERATAVALEQIQNFNVDMDVQVWGSRKVEETLEMFNVGDAFRAASRNSYLLVSSRPLNAAGCAPSRRDGCVLPRGRVQQRWCRWVPMP